MTAAGAVAVACQPQTVVVKETVEVEKEVEKVVKETVVVEKEVEKEVTKVVEKEVTTVVEKEVEKVVTVGGYPVPREETLVINETGIQRIFDSANPFVPNALIGGWNQVCGARLMYLNWAGGESINMLIEEFEYNDDYTAITFYVRNQAHWNDGEPFTARDIEFTVDMVKSNTALSWGATMQQWVESMDVPDDFTITFNLTKPNPRFHWYFKQAWACPIIAKHEWEGQDPITYKAFPPIGTGPYKFHSAVPEQRMIIWERDENFWGKALGYEAGPRYYIYQTGPPPEAEMADLADNYIDHAHSYTSDEQLLRRSQELNPAVVLAPWRDPCPRGIWFNCAKYPLSLPEVAGPSTTVSTRKKQPTYSTPGRRCPPSTTGPTGVPTTSTTLTTSWTNSIRVSARRRGPRSWMVSALLPGRTASAWTARATRCRTPSSSRKWA
jgi:hypothetical protein